MRESPPEIIAEAIPEPEKERLVFGLDDVKDIVAQELGNKAKIERLDISEITQGLQLSAELYAGLTGGKISIEGLIAIDGDGLTIRDVNIEARSYVKSMIEGNLSKFPLAIKNYFKNKYGKPVSSISIDGSSLVVELDDIKEANFIAEESKPKTEFESRLEDLYTMKPSHEKNYFIDKFYRELLKEGRFDDVRTLITKLSKNEESRTKGLANLTSYEEEYKQKHRS